MMYMGPTKEFEGLLVLLDLKRAIGNTSRVVRQSGDYRGYRTVNGVTWANRANVRMHLLLAQSRSTSTEHEPLNGESENEIFISSIYTCGRLCLTQYVHEM